jgi:phosphate transport system ATP-binding protein
MSEESQISAAAPVNSTASHQAGVAVAARPPLRLNGLSVGFGKVTVLDSINVSFSANVVNALIGPTGCGKSTLLRTLNRLNDRVRGYWRRGEVLFGSHGQEIGEADPLELRRRVGMVFQRPNPFPMSIRDNVIAGVKAHGMAPRRDYDQIAEHRLRQVGLWNAVSNRLNDSPFRLSGGQQQLLCLARALAVEPEILLLDEPTSSLDPISTSMVEGLLVELKTDLTMVMVTHNLAQARRIAETTTFFYGGRMVESGATGQVFDDPTEAETVSYVSGQIG